MPIWKGSFPPHGNVLSSNSQYLLPALRESVQVKSGHGSSGSSCEEEEEDGEEEDGEEDEDGEEVPAPGEPRLLPVPSEGTGGDNLGVGAGRGWHPPGLGTLCPAQV